MVITVIMRPWQAASAGGIIIYLTDLLAGLEAPKEQELFIHFRSSQATVLTLGTLRNDSAYSGARS